MCTAGSSKLGRYGGFFFFRMLVFSRLSRMNKDYFI